MIADNNKRLQEIIINKISELLVTLDGVRTLKSRTESFIGDVRNWQCDGIDRDQVCDYKIEITFNELGRIEAATIEINCKYY